MTVSPEPCTHQIASLSQKHYSDHVLYIQDFR